MPVFAWALGAIGAIVLVKLFNREWQRVNDELDRVQPVRVNDPERAGRADACAAIRRPASTAPSAEANRSRDAANRSTESQ